MLLSSMAWRSSLLEKAGFALPVGMAAVTLAMLLMDWAHIALTRTSMTILTLTLLLAAIAANGKKLLMLTHKRPAFHIAFNKSHLTWLNLLWLLMLMGVIWLEYVNISKCLIYPTYDRDSMAAFDTFPMRTFIYMVPPHRRLFPPLYTWDSSSASTACVAAG